MITWDSLPSTIKLSRDTRERLAGLLSCLATADAPPYDALTEFAVGMIVRSAVQKILTPSEIADRWRKAVGG